MSLRRLAFLRKWGIIFCLMTLLSASQNISLAAICNTATAADTIQKEAAEKSETIKIHICDIHITGQTVFSQGDLQKIVKDSIGQDLSIKELAQVADQITQYYRSHGYMVAKAYIPEQDMADGVVALTVVEGVYGKIYINNLSRLKQQAIVDVLEKVQPGQVIVKSELERAILLLNDLPGIEARLSLSPGSRFGQTDLSVEVTDAKAVAGTVQMNNSGSKYTGENVAGLTLELQNPFGRGDAIVLEGLLSNGAGLDRGRISYEAPLSGMGWYVGAGYSRMNYQLGEDFSLLDGYGTAKSFNTYVRYALVRSYKENLGLQISYENKRLNDSLNAVSISSVKSSNAWTLSLTGDKRDPSVVHSYLASFSTGRLGIKTMAAEEFDSITAKSAGMYGKYTIHGVRLQKINEHVSWYTSLSGQSANKNLDPSEKMSLGGAYGVRAYPNGEASGDEGYLLTTELRFVLPTSAQFPGQLLAAGFFDTGKMRANKDPWDSSVNQKRLSGVGLGLIWQKDKEFFLRIDYAWKTGRTVDSSDNNDNGRLWFRGATYF